jgi:hypothetical protein
VCISEHRIDCFVGASDPVEAFILKLVDIANLTVSKTSPNPRKIAKPWFNDNCKAAINDRKEALKNNPSSTNLENFWVNRAKARRVIRQVKRDNWQDYVSKLNSQTPMKKVWNMVRRISGKPSPITVTHLKINNASVELPQEIANTLGTTLAHISSSAHYTEFFRRYKVTRENRQITFHSNNLQSYNTPFSAAELRKALCRSHDSATSPDKIHYQFLKHLPEGSLSTLLKIFNDVWQRADFPSGWTEAMVIPIT